MSAALSRAAVSIDLEHGSRTARGRTPASPSSPEFRGDPLACDVPALAVRRAAAGRGPRPRDLLPPPEGAHRRPLHPLRPADLHRRHARGGGRLPVPRVRQGGGHDGRAAAGPPSPWAGPAATTRILIITNVAMFAVELLTGASSACSPCNSATGSCSTWGAMVPVAVATPVLAVGHGDVPARRADPPAVQHVRAVPVRLP